MTGIGAYTGSTQASFAIVPATPTVSSWPSASAILDGQPLSASTLSGGAASVAGAFAFTAPETVPPVSGLQSVTFTPQSANYARVSGSVPVEVTPLTDAATPAISAQPQDVAVSVGGDATLSLTASVTSGVLSYQWYSNPTRSNAGGASIDGATGDSFAAPTGAPGTTYYYCVVTNTDAAATGSQTATAASDAAEVRVSAIDIAAATIAAIPDQTYTGAALEPGADGDPGRRHPGRGHRLHARLRGQRRRRHGHRDGDRHRRLHGQQAGELRDRAGHAHREQLAQRLGHPLRPAALGLDAQRRCGLGGRRLRLHRAGARCRRSPACRA